ncbi:MAG: DUF805 domain-containing protein [Puniceicoccales bacterium]|jgi:uncharacterized membrane protein YhaH (DUF805 family)|nr:DUF805 domain-containing protein [Puniceicoccales bacterium]
MKYYITCWEKYAVFSGRACREEFWTFSLLNIFILYGLGFVIGWCNSLVGNSEETSLAGAVSDALGILLGLPLLVLYFGFLLAALLPMLAVQVRRLHDTGRSGWNYLWGFLPIIGGIILFVFNLLDSQPGPNKYGPNPKETPPPVAK